MTVRPLSRQCDLTHCSQVLVKQMAMWRGWRKKAFVISLSNTISLCCITNEYIKGNLHKNVFCSSTFSCNSLGWQLVLSSWQFVRTSNVSLFPCLGSPLLKWFQHFWQGTHIPLCLLALLCGLWRNFEISLPVWNGIALTKHGLLGKTLIQRKLAASSFYFNRVFFLMGNNKYWIEWKKGGQLCSWARMALWARFWWRCVRFRKEKAHKGPFCVCLGPDAGLQSPGGPV